MKATTLELARSTGNRPRLHPNGFIQLDLSASTRLHVWPSEKLQAQATEHIVHDHIFDMLSVVVTGEMQNDVFTFSEYANGAHQLYQAAQVGGHDKILKPTGRRGDLIMHHRDIVKPGETYFLPAFYLHTSTASELTATVMVKVRIHANASPVIAVPVGVEPDNEYRRDSTSEALLWNWIERALA